MHCGKMSAPGRQLPVGQIYAARVRNTGTAQTGATQSCSPRVPLLFNIAHELDARAAMRSEFRTQVWKKILGLSSQLKH